MVENQLGWDFDVWRQQIVLLCLVVLVFECVVKRLDPRNDYDNIEKMMASQEYIWRYA